MLGTQVIPTAALVVLMAPVALGAAGSLGISPQLLMMTVAIAASSSFASPLSHPAHLLVMGPGGYRFTDYFKVGVPLTIISLIVRPGGSPETNTCGEFGTMRPIWRVDFRNALCSTSVFRSHEPPGRSPGTSPRKTEAALFHARLPDRQSLSTQGFGHPRPEPFLVPPCIDITGAGY